MLRAALSLSAAALLTLTACKKIEEAAPAPSAAASAPAPPPACDAAEVDNALKAIEEAGPTERGAMAIRALTEICPSGSHARLSASLRGLDRREPADRMRALAQAIQDNQPLWYAGCPAGTKVFEELAALGPDERPALLRMRCGLAEATWAANGGGGLLVAILYRRALADAGVPREKAEALLTAVAVAGDL